MFLNKYVLPTVMWSSPNNLSKGWDGRYGIAVATDISEAHPGFMAFVGAAPW